MHQKFNPQDWLPNDSRTDIDLVVSRIEAAHTDITGSYADWRNLGFALADELGEGGRDCYHRISRFYSKYSYTDCNKQYDQCLKSTGHGITIKTFFHLAKQAGIDLGGAAVFNRTFNKGPETGDAKNENRERDMEQDAVKNRSSLLVSSSPEPPDAGIVEMQTLPDSIFSTLPDFFQRVVAKAEFREERDILLLGALGALSACLHKVVGLYDGYQVYPNLYLFISAPASAGKGRLGLCLRLIMPIHWQKRKESQQLKQDYESDMKEYNLARAKGCEVEKPMKPPEKLLLIPANSSASGFFELLSENEGNGLIFETEGDTMTQALKSDYGNYSDGLRKGYHHEMISYYRKTDRVHKEIEEPCISVVMTGTPKQVFALIPSAENGLMSRYIFYRMNIRLYWKDVFVANKDKGLKEYFNTLGQEFYTLYKALNENPSIGFSLTKEQEDQFNAFFSQIQDKYLMLQGMDYIATIRRLGLIAYRIAMIFTALRILETGDFSEKQFCSEVDFKNTLEMIRILIKHSSQVFSELPVDNTPIKSKNKKEQFLDSLPEKFTRLEFIEIAKGMAIVQRTAESYIANFCEKDLILREQKGVYSNPNFSAKKGEMEKM